MKTERRHELQTNALADWIGRHLEPVQGYSRLIFGVVLLVVAAAIAGTYIKRSQEARKQTSWNAYYRAISQRSSEALEDMSRSYLGTQAALWAKQSEADILLADGINALYVSRDRGKELLQQARQAYEAVAAAAPDPLLRERAWFGLGQTHESLAELDKARDYYGRVTARSPESALGKEAKRRTDLLSRPETEKWYNWFANQKSRPPLPGLDRLPGLSDQFDLGSLPDLPNLPARTAAAPSATESATAAGPEPSGTETESDDSTKAEQEPAPPASGHPDE